MPTADKIEIGNKFVGLFIGPSGSGKTPSACSFLDAHPDKDVKVFDFDGRLDSILNTPWIDRSRIDFNYYPPVKDPKTQGLMNDKIENDILAFKIMDTNRFNTVILDGLPMSAFILMQDILPTTHNGQNNNGIMKGRKIGSQNVAGPEDYFYEFNGVTKIVTMIKALPIQNIIITCHVEDILDKEDPDNPMSRTVKVGERLALRNKLSVTIPGLFSHIFRFDRKWLVDKNQITVTFWSDICRSVYPNLPEKLDITGKSFYKELMSFNKKF